MLHFFPAIALPINYSCSSHATSQKNTSLQKPLVLHPTAILSGQNGKPLPNNRAPAAQKNASAHANKPGPNDSHCCTKTVLHQKKQLCTKTVLHPKRLLADGWQFKMPDLVSHDADHRMVALMVEDESPTTFARLIKQRLLAPHVVPGHHVVSHAVGRVHVIARRHHIRDKTDRPLRIIKLDRLQSPGMSRSG